MKYIGAGLIVLGSTFIGFYSAICYKKELSFLRTFLRLIEFMSCQLQYKLTPLPTLFRETASQTTGYFAALFTDAANELDAQNKCDVKSCFACALSKQKNIPNSLQYCLYQFAEAIGRFDLKGQLQDLEHIRSVCTDQIKLLETGREERLRCNRTLGICAGAALAIVLI